MPDPQACRTPVQLEQYVRRTLPAGEVQAIAQHIETCGHCADAVERLIAREPQTAASPDGSDTIALPGAIDFGDPPRGNTPEPSIAGVEHRRFAVLQSHAQGGLGEVFLALDQQMNREVALKQIQAEFARDPDCRQRFLLEAEITGRLEHPGIVPVYARGIYEDGRLYYAMRFIRGESLKDALVRFHSGLGTAHSALNSLEFRKLLNRFIDVCNAIAYAHSRGVVHRDIKPSNVMLGPYGETLVVDWGLAKLLDAPDKAPAAQDSLPPLKASSSTSTQMGIAVGTPAYMSPEQAQGWQPHIGPASDIYSLGATLYELLTGQPPFAIDQARTLEDMLQRVTSGRFPPPRKIDPRIPAPLEAICLKAMAIERGDRYATARELADEVEAWLADEPVRAWPEPWNVRLARWRRRHRSLVTSLTTAAAALLVSLTLGISMLISANQRIANERDRAELNFTQLRLASNEMMDVIEQWLSRSPEALSVQQVLLKKGLQFYEQFLQQEPTNSAVRAEMAANHLRVAGIRRLLGQYDLAAEHSRAAQGEFRALAEQDVQAIEHRRRWAESSNWLGEALRLSGQFDEARQAYDDAIHIGEQLHTQQPRDTNISGELARVQYNLGLLLHGGGHLPAAQQAFDTAIALLDEAVDTKPDDRELRQHLARCHINLGILLKDKQQPLEADREYLRAIELLKRLSADAPDEPEYRSELAVAHTDHGNLLYVRREDARLVDREPLAGAMAAYREAIGLLVPLTAEYAGVPRYRKELASAYNGLGSVYLVEMKLKPAREAWQEARRQQEALVAASPKLADYRNALGLTLGNLALVALREEDPQAGRQLFEEAIRHQAEAVRLAPENVAYVRFLNNNRYSLAKLHLAGGAHEMAVEQADQLVVSTATDRQECLRVARLIARCAAAAGTDANLNEAARQQAVDDYERRAMRWLQTAAASGLKDAAILEGDTDFQPLSDRTDFQRLLESIKADSKP